MNQHTDNTHTVLALASFKRLVKVRNTLRFVLAFLVFALHGFFVGGIAFYNQWFAQPLSATSSIPQGIIYTALVIVLLIVLEFIYIRVSRDVVEPLQQQTAAEVSALD